MEALLVRRFVSATGLQGRALLRTRTPKVIRQQAVKSILSSIKMIRTKRLKDPHAVFRPTFKDGLHDAIRIATDATRYHHLSYYQLSSVATGIVTPPNC